MKNINILALDGDTARMWGFPTLKDGFTYHFTVSGLFLTEAQPGTPQACHIEDGECADPAFVEELKRHGYQYGTLLRLDDHYLGSFRPRTDFTLQELVDQFWSMETERYLDAATD